MCGDYYLVSKQTHFDKYTMPLLEETFDALKQANVLIPWTCNLAIISCHWRWQRSNGIGELIFMGIIVCTNDGFYHLVWKMSRRILEGHGSNVDEMLHWWHHYFLLDPKRSHALIMRNVYKIQKI